MAGRVRPANDVEASSLARVFEIIDDDNNFCDVITAMGTGGRCYARWDEFYGDNLLCCLEALVKSVDEWLTLGDVVVHRIKDGPLVITRPFSQEELDVAVGKTQKSP